MDIPAELSMRLPVANESNKKLEAEVNRKEAEINALQSQIEDHGERIQALRDHRKNVLQELNQTQALYEARRRDHQTEDHMKQIAEREDGRLKVEMKRAASQLEDIQEQMNIYENNIYRIIHEIESLKDQMKWDQQTLDAYLEESARKDEDVLLLQKYSRQDEGKVKELTLRIQNLHENLARNRRALDNERTETVSAQIELDKTAEEFRQAHQERQELLHQWESTISQMKRRDSDMDKAATDLAATRSEIRNKSEAVKEKSEFLDQEKQNNEEVTKKVSMAERQAAKMRLDYQDAETTRMQFKDELETLKYSVDRTATDLEGMRAQCAVLARQVKEQTQRLETYQIQRRTLQGELHKKMQMSLTAEERAQEMDEVMSIEEANIKRLEREVEKSREKQFKKTQEVYVCKQGETVLKAELQGGRVAARNLSSKQHKLDEETLKQQEILYTQDFQLQQQERKVGRLQGDRSDEEQSALNDKMKELEAENAAQQQKEQLLKAQLKGLQDDLRRVGRRLEKSSKDKAQLTGRIDELNLHIDSTQRELKRVVAQKQDLMVDENIHKLEVRRLRETLFARADDVLSLEKRKLHLHTAMSERTKEIDLHKEMLQAETKTSEADRQTASSELHERISKIEKLRKRYEILEVSMAPPEGEENHSQAYYVIKAAQEREELQRKGDDLDGKIQKAEREIKALGNTLSLMNSRNETFRKSLTQVESSGEEVVELEHLEGQLRTLMDKFKHQRRELKQTKDDTKSMTETLTALDSRKDVFVTLVGERKKLVADLQRDIGEQQQKQDRVVRQTAKLQKEIRSKKGTLEATAEEQDISLRELRDLNLAVAQQLAQVTTQHGDLTDTMRQMFAEANLPPLATPSSSRLGSRPASSQSSSRSALSHRSSASTRGGPTPIQPKALEIEMGSARSTPRDPLSSRSSTSSVGSKKPLSSRASSKASSRQSLRALSVASSSKTGSKQTLDLSIGPA